MASGAEEPPEQSSFAETAATSQLQRAGWWEAAADGLCPICLGKINNAAYINICFHAFCFSCIQRWATMRAACPLCRRPFDHVLNVVRVDNNCQEYMVSSSAHGQRTTARERVHSRSPQRRYHLRPRPTINDPAGRRRPAGRNRVAWRDAAPRTSNTSAQQAVGEHPASPLDGPILRFDMLALRERLMAFMDIE